MGLPRAVCGIGIGIVSESPFLLLKGRNHFEKNSGVLRLFTKKVDNRNRVSLSISIF